MSERNHPVYDHYGSGVYEAIKIINSYNLNFNLGNAVKYILRAGKKDNNPMVSDLKKAVDYLQYEIERITEPEEEQCNPVKLHYPYECVNCKHYDRYGFDMPCIHCVVVNSKYPNRWEAK